MIQNDHYTFFLHLKILNNNNRNNYLFIYLSAFSTNIHFIKFKNYIFIFGICFVLDNLNGIEDCRLSWNAQN